MADKSIIIWRSRDIFFDIFAVIWFATVKDKFHFFML